MADIQVKQVYPLTVMSLSFTGSYEQTQQKVDELMSWLLRMGHPYSAPPMALYLDDPAKVAPASLRAEVCLPVEEKCEPGEDIQRKDLPAVTVAFAMHEGPYNRIPQLYQEVFAWIAANGYRYVQGAPTREVFHKIHGMVDSPDQFLSEVQVPVQKA